MSENITLTPASLVIDTFSSCQTDAYIELELAKRAENDRLTIHNWKDFSVDAFKTVMELQRMGYITILILGHAGMGKTMGMRNLIPHTNIWFNCDNKDAIWEGGSQEYGEKDSPNKNQRIVNNFPAILSLAQAYSESGLFEDRLKICFCLGHIEFYDKGNKQRMQLLGNLGNKMGIENRFDMVYYAEKYKFKEGLANILRYVNLGNDTARTYQNFHPNYPGGCIPNDFSIIIKDLYRYKGKQGLYDNHKTEDFNFHTVDFLTI